MRLACRSAGVRACGQCSAPSLLPCSAPNGGQQPRAVLQGQSQRLRARESAPTLQIASTSPAPLARTGPLRRLSRVDWLEPSGTTKRLSKRLAVGRSTRAASCFQSRRFARSRTAATRRASVVTPGSRILCSRRYAVARSKRTAGRSSANHARPKSHRRNGRCVGACPNGWYLL